jgi:hypothetical protein
MKPLRAHSVSLFDKLGREGVRYLGTLALRTQRSLVTPPPAPQNTPAPHSAGEFLLEAFSSGAPRLSGRG